MFSATLPSRTDTPAARMHEHTTAHTCGQACGGACLHMCAQYQKMRTTYFIIKNRRHAYACTSTWPCVCTCMHACMHAILHAIMHANTSKTEQSVVHLHARMIIGPYQNIQVIEQSAGVTHVLMKKYAAHSFQEMHSLRLCVFVLSPCADETRSRS